MSCRSLNILLTNINNSRKWPVKMLRLLAVVWPLPAVEPVRVSWSEEPAFQPRPGLDPWHIVVQQVCDTQIFTPRSTPLLLLQPFLSGPPSALTISLTPPSRPTCWSTPVASVSFCLQVRLLHQLASSAPNQTGFDVQRKCCPHQRCSKWILKTVYSNFFLFRQTKSLFKAPLCLTLGTFYLAEN